MPVLINFRASYEQKNPEKQICSQQVLGGIWLTTFDAVPNITRLESEKYYKDPNKNNATYAFPFLEEEGSLDLSLVVPAYNEEERRKDLREARYVFRRSLF